MKKLQKTQKKQKKFLRLGHVAQHRYCIGQNIYGKILDN